MKMKREKNPDAIVDLDAQIEKVIDRIEILLPDGDESAIDSAFHELFDICDKRFAGYYIGYEEYKTNFRIMTLIMRNHIRKNNNLDLAVHSMEYIQEWNHMLQDPSLTETERVDLKYEMAKYRAMLMDYMRKEEALQAAVDDKYDQLMEEGIDPSYQLPMEFPGPDPINVYPEDSVCKLCGKHIADEVGSHAVPNNLIERLFSIDGKGGRDRCVVERYNLARKSYTRYIGRDIYDNNQIVKLINRNLRDDEMWEGHAHNPLTFDHIFCKECEKRLSTLESVYSQIMHGRKKYPSALPYLFWMSVTWRMSVAGLGIKLNPETEEKYREILDRCLARKEAEIITEPAQLGDCAYALFKAKDLKGELTGIFGVPVGTVPALYIIGDTIVQFYPDKQQAKVMLQQCVINDYALNEGVIPEITNEVKFIEFWRVKRQILKDIRENVNPIDDETLDLLRAEASTEEDLKEIDEFDSLPPTPDVSMIYKLENATLKHLEETGEVAIFEPMARVPDGYVINVPNSIKRCMDYARKHPGVTGKKLAEALGYTEKELAFMWEYYLADIDEALEEE